MCVCTYIYRYVDIYTYIPSPSHASNVSQSKAWAGSGKANPDQPGLAMPSSPSLQLASQARPCPGQASPARLASGSAQACQVQAWPLLINFKKAAFFGKVQKSR